MLVSTSHRSGQQTSDAMQLNGRGMRNTTETFELGGATVGARVLSGFDSTQPPQRMGALPGAPVHGPRKALTAITEVEVCAVEEYELLPDGSLGNKLWSSGDATSMAELSRVVRTNPKYFEAGVAPKQGLDCVLL